MPHPSELDANYDEGDVIYDEQDGEDDGEDVTDSMDENGSVN